MSNQKPLEKLTIKDCFMFGAVMTEPENCRLLLERTLQIPIREVIVSKEKSIIYNPEYKGVRLDVYAHDENNTRYDVEMQVLSEADIERRARYYHSQIDMDILLAGEKYKNLPNVYVIFVCDFDPFGEGKYKYTFLNTCEEVPNLKMDDGNVTIFLSTKGQNHDEVPETLIKFLEYVGDDLEESKKDYSDPFVARLQQSVQYVKKSREMEARYMQLKLMLEDEREKGFIEGEKHGRALGKALGKAESVLSFLSALGAVPKELNETIISEKNLDTLEKWMKLASKVESIEEFCEKM